MNKEPQSPSSTSSGRDRPSGRGKTTTVRLLVGFARPGGQATVWGTPSARLSAAQRWLAGMMRSPARRRDLGCLLCLLLLVRSASASLPAGPGVRLRADAAGDLHHAPAVRPHASTVEGRHPHPPVRLGRRGARAALHRCWPSDLGHRAGPALHPACRLAGEPSPTPDPPACQITSILQSGSRSGRAQVHVATASRSALSHP